MRRMVVLALLVASCGEGDEPPARRSSELLFGMDLNGNRAFGMSFNAKNELVVSGTAHNKRPAIARWDGSRWHESNVPEQVWLERLPSGEVLGVGPTKLFSFGTDGASVKEIGAITPNPRSAFNQSSARIGGDGSIWFVLDVGRFHRIPPGTTAAVEVPVPAGTDPETALPGAYARTGDGQVFAGVRGAGIFSVSASGAEMIVPCSDPEIDDCNGGDILVVDSYAREPLFRKGTVGAKVYRLDLTTRRLRLVADLAKLEDRVLTAVADAPNGDIYLVVQRSHVASEGGNVLRVTPGSDPTAVEELLPDIVLVPASIAVRSDGRIFLNSGFVIEEIR